MCVGRSYIQNIQTYQQMQPLHIKYIFTHIINVYTCSVYTGKANYHVAFSVLADELSDYASSMHSIIKIVDVIIIMKKVNKQAVSRRTSNLYSDKTCHGYDIVKM